VSFFDKFRGDKDEEAFTKEPGDIGYIPMSTLVRWYLYDMQVTNGEELAQELDIPLISQEGVEMEQRDSEIRMARVAPYEDFVSGISEINSYVINSIQMKNYEKRFEELRESLDHDESEAIDSIIEDSIVLFNQISLAASLFTLSAGFAIGLFQEGYAEANRGITDEQQ